MASTRVPNHHLPEIFADQVHSVIFDGVAFRIELTVGRPPDNAADSAELMQHTVARLVLPLSATNELVARLTSSLETLERNGVLRREARVPPQLQN